MYITKERFDLLYRVYTAAQREMTMRPHLTFSYLGAPVRVLQEHEIGAVTEQLMYGENNREHNSTSSL